jgi:hypothetical protein
MMTSIFVLILLYILWARCAAITDIQIIATGYENSSFHGVSGFGWVSFV